MKEHKIFYIMVPHYMGKKKKKKTFNSFNVIFWFKNIFFCVFFSFKWKKKKKKIYKLNNMKGNVMKLSQNLPIYIFNIL